MTKLEVLKRTEVSAADILREARTIPTNNARSCDWIDSQWVSPERCQRWAKLSFKDGDDQGLASAVRGAKRGAYHVIDTLILKYHLAYAKKRSYPEKIAGLRKIGISIDSIILELIGERRNELEHRYKVPEPEEAAHAIQVAGLFLAAMREEFESRPIIAFDWNLLGGFRNSQDTADVIEFTGFSPNPMFFINVFEKQIEIKIVDPQASEVLSAPLSIFSEEDSTDPNVYLRSHYSHKKRDLSDIPKSLAESLKSQADL